MGKRKRSGTSKSPGDQPVQPAGSAAVEDDAATADMTHVTPDVLAGSPDIFASKQADPPATELEANSSPEEEAAAQPVVEATEEEQAAEPPEPAAELPEPAAEDVPEPAVEAQAPSPIAPSPALAALVSAAIAPAAAAQPVRKRPGNTSLALGVVLVVVGLFALAVAVSGVDITQYGWPLFVIVPGLTLLVVGFVGAGAAASIPGGIITMFGLVLAYQTYSGDWASWTFAWTAVAPFGVGLGMYLQALRERDSIALRRGRMLIFIGAILFIVGFVFFESILNVSNRDYGLFGKAALPLLLIVFGIVLLVRSARRGAKA